MKFVLKKLAHSYIWRRIFYERLTEPLHLNLLSVFVWLFGSFRRKVEFDLVVRQHFAFGLLKAADDARALGLRKITVIEFGVGAGAGLLNICHIAKSVTKETGVGIEIFGFDTGAGLPPPVDYRDHPDQYQQSDYRMDFDKLKAKLPSNAHLILGNISETLPLFLENLSAQEPLGFVSLDVDYYSSSKDALRILTNDSSCYLPITQLYVDDIGLESHNNYCGELLAINEFNRDNLYRKIEHHRFFKSNRLFQRANWLNHMYQVHILDHKIRYQTLPNGARVDLENPYL